MNHLSEEDMIKNIEQLMAFLPTVHVGTVSLEIMLEEYKKVKQKLQQEKEKNKILEEEMKQDFKDDYIKRHELNTVIHIMADDMMNGVIPRFKNSIELKDYYFKKARGEEDENWNKD